MSAPTLKSLAHKSCESQVLISAVDSQGSAVSIPRAHRVVPTGRRTVPTVLLVEGLRQAGFAAAHTTLDVPLDASFLLDEVALVLTGAPVPFPDYGPSALRYEVSASDVDRRGCRFDMTVLAPSGTTVATGHALTRWLRPAQYAAVRRERPAPTTRRMDEGDVAWDLDDPFHFDHPADHVPGILFVAVAEDHAMNVRGGSFRGGRWAFPRFAELDAPIVVDDDGTALAFRQRGELVASFLPAAS